MDCVGMVCAQKTRLARDKTPSQEWQYKNLRVVDFKGVFFCNWRSHKVIMLDDKTPRLKSGPPSRGSSFYIENLLGTTGRRSSAEERAETPSFKLTGHDPGMCPGLKTRRLSDTDRSDGSGTFANTANGCSRSEFAPDRPFRPIEKVTENNKCSFLFRRFVPCLSLTRVGLKYITHFIIDKQTSHKPPHLTFMIYASRFGVSMGQKWTWRMVRVHSPIISRVEANSIWHPHNDLTTISLLFFK